MIEQPQHIIEVNHSMSKEQQELTQKFFEGMLDMDDITIYSTKEYSSVSIYADTICDEINKLNAQNLEQEY